MSAPSPGETYYYRLLADLRNQETTADTLRADTAAVIPELSEPGKRVPVKLAGKLKDAGSSRHLGTSLPKQRLRAEFPVGLHLLAECLLSFFWLGEAIPLIPKQSSAMCGGTKRHNPQQGSQWVLCALSTVAVLALDQPQLVLLIPRCVQGNWN